MKVHRLSAILAVLFLVMTGCSEKTDKKRETAEENSKGDKVQQEIQRETEALNQKEGLSEGNTGYALPMTEEEKASNEEAIKKEAELIKEKYSKIRSTLKEDESLSYQMVGELIAKASAEGEAVIDEAQEWNMTNYETVKEAFKKVKEGQDAEAIITEIDIQGELYRLAFTYKEGAMTVIEATGTWTGDCDFEVLSVTKSKVAEYEYTDQGHFMYEIVRKNGTELVNGNGILRVEPLSKECLSLTNEVIKPIGYQGTNLFLTDWDTKDIKDLDLNDTFEAFYYLDTGKVVDLDAYPNGIPKQEFEDMMSKYIGITKKQVEEKAVLDENTKNYKYKWLGCGNYSPDMWGVAESEVISVKENEDKSLTLTVQAVWPGAKVEKAFVHKVTLKREANGEITFLSNQMVLEDGDIIPNYEHRTR